MLVWLFNMREIYRHFIFSVICFVSMVFYFHREIIFFREALYILTPYTIGRFLDRIGIWITIFLCNMMHFCTFTSMFVHSSSLFQTVGSAEEAKTISLLVVGLPGHQTYLWFLHLMGLHQRQGLHSTSSCHTSRIKGSHKTKPWNT